MMRFAWLITVLVIVGSLLDIAVTAPSTPQDNTAGTEIKDVLSGCKDKPADIYFLLDCSSSVWVVDYDKLKEFVVSLVYLLDIHPTATRVGLGVFSDDFYHILDIGGYPDKNTLIRTIRHVPYFSGNTYTGRGIHGMRTHGFRDGVARTNVTKIGVVVTDGRSRHRTNTVSEATLAKEDHIWLFSIGVGSHVDDEELTAIASLPKNEFRFHVASFDILSTLAQTLAVSTCSLKRPQSDGAVCGLNEKADVMFVYNAGAMSSTDLDTVVSFVQYLVGQFSMSSGNVRVGVVSAGSQGGDILLDQHIRQKDLLDALMNQPRPKMSPLFKKLRLRGFDPTNGGRRNAKKRVVVFLDDVVEDVNDVLYETFLLRYDNEAQIDVIMVGNDADLEQAKQMVTSPAHITQFASFSALLDEGRRKEFLDKFCQGL